MNRLRTEIGKLLDIKRQANPTARSPLTLNPDPTKNEPVVSRQDWALHGFATQWRVLLLELVRGRILAQRRKGSKGKRGGALANLAPWREESFPAPPMVGSDLVGFRDVFQCQ